jgi:cyanophycinase
MKNRKGYLIPIGGAEDKGTADNRSVENAPRTEFSKDGILRQIVNLLPQKNGVIEVITTASSQEKEMEKRYKEAFAKLTDATVNAMNISEREEVDQPTFLERIKNCDAVVFTGGDQLRLSTIYGGTEQLHIMKQRYEQDALIVAGTSAGAMAMGDAVIYEGDASRAYLKGEVRLMMGFNFINGLLIDTHFEERGRFYRLSQAIAEQPGTLGVGLGEDTGLIIREGNIFQVIGSGVATIIDGTRTHMTNIAAIEDGQPISVDHLTVHILCEGDLYNLEKQSVEKMAINDTPSTSKKQ